MTLLVEVRPLEADPIVLEIAADSTVSVGELVERMRHHLVLDDAEYVLRVAQESLQGVPGDILDNEGLVHSSGLVSGMSVELVRAVEGSPRPLHAALSSWELVLDRKGDRRVVPLEMGLSSLGSSATCRVTVEDGDVASTHAYLDTGADVSIHAAQGADLKSAAGRKIGATSLSPDSDVYVGQWRLRVRHRAGADVVVRDSPARAYLPPVRIELEAPPNHIVLPRLPQSKTLPPFPFVSLLVPIAIAGAMYALTRSTFVIMLAVVMPIMALANYWSQCERVRKEQADALREFDDALDGARAEIHSAHEAERARLAMMVPASQVIVEWDSPKCGDLWAVREEHSDFLTLRLGTGHVASQVELKGEAQTHGSREQRGALEMLRDQARTFEGPVTVSLRETRGLGITGAGRFDCAASLAVQLAGRHSPSDVRLVLVCSPAFRESVRTIAWLPHAQSANGGKTRILDSEESLAAWVGNRMPGFHAESSVEGGQVVVLALEPTSRQLTLLTMLMEAWEKHEGPGPCLIVTAAERLSVPGACSALVEASTSNGVLLRRGDSVPVPIEECEAVSDDSLLSWAKRLAPLVDARGREHVGEAIPATVSLLDINGRERRSLDESLLEEWHLSDWAESLTLDALVGYGAAGPLTIPLRRWGPHALVAGTTGSGKSEFLQSWILGLALNYSPRRVTFLFVDYKGGAALGECARLPHCTGLVTDLGPELVARALISLRAELRYREELLARFGAKDIDEYASIGGTDLPAFVIVVDEFAALRDDCPDFLDGLIDVAQRGRSLGVHLILATQRPAGIVSERLRANVSLRIALRLSDAADSIDVIGSKAAAQISLDNPGRAIVSAVGAGLHHEAQMAYAGARGPADRSANLKLDLAHAMNDEKVLSAWNARPRGLPPKLTRGAEQPPTDAHLAVEAAIRAWERRGTTVRAPWLPPLVENYTGEALVEEWGLPAPYAIVDDPSRQRRTVARIGPPGSIYGVYGASGTGRSTSIISIVRSTRTAQEPPRLFIIDSMSQGLRSLIDEPHALGYVPGEDTASALRMLRTLANVESSSGSAILVLDSFASLCHEAHPSDREEIHSLLGALARTARARRLTLVIGASGPNELPRSLESMCTERIVHRLSRAEDYAMCAGAVKLEESSPVGRASVGGLEAHIALFAEPSSREETRRRACRDAFMLGRRTLDIPQAQALVQDAKRGLVGFAHADGAPASLPLTGGGLITGGEEAERLALLDSLSLLAREREVLRAPHGASGDIGEAKRLLNHATVLGTNAFVILDDIAALESSDGASDLGAVLRNALAAGACVYGGLKGGSFSRLGPIGPHLARAGCGIVLGAREGEVFTLFGRTPPRTRWASDPDVAWLVDGADCRLIVPALVRDPRGK
ncbi:FtsK/SpoIIIE domain-containing protein [Dermabacter sp. p3-SID358]|uniref:FtsK/SpoIIIE domain-containing protein n=1 Tax=Dermabacter sp. p3-SID358 TaxID=2916114 RepID=UPI0021A477F8|nr:FtsK/SpoIIIE domain-containing protein [Dermabacter sp. p3-SID358]MCT1867745.1 FtsK/SpoIIIE domain-containing protein [Dermabacter sp. p3-SID358]